MESQKLWFLGRMFFWFGRLISAPAKTNEFHFECWTFGTRHHIWNKSVSFRNRWRWFDYIILRQFWYDALILLSFFEKYYKSDSYLSFNYLIISAQNLVAFYRAKISRPQHRGEMSLVHKELNWSEARKLPTLAIDKSLFGWRFSPVEGDKHKSSCY